MSSTTSPSSGFFASPRKQQLLLWVSGGVLVVGIAVFLGVILSRGNGQPVNVNLSTVSTPPPAKTTPAQTVHVKPAARALQVARAFLLTAVERNNTGASYDIVGPDLKGSMTKAQWAKGNIPVTFYPAGNAKTAKLDVKSSTKNELMIEVGLRPRPGVHMKALGFSLHVDRIGGKWLVNYFLPDYSYKVRANPYSN